MSLKSSYILLIILLVLSSIATAQLPDNPTPDQKKADSLLKVVRSHYYDKDYKNAIEKGNELIQFSEKTGDQKNSVKASSLIGNSFLQRGDTIESQKLFEKSLQRAQKSKDAESIITASIDLANVYALSRNYSKAIDYYQEVIPLAINKNDTISLFLLNYNIGESYLELKKGKQAIPYIENTDIYVKKLALPYRIGQKALNGKFNYLIGDYDLAAEYFDQALILDKKLEYKELLIDIYKNYASNEEKRGDYEKTNLLLKKFYELNEEKYKIDKISAVEDAIAKFKVNQIEQKLLNSQFENEIAKERATRNTILVTGAVALFFLIGFVFFLLFIQRKRKNLLVSLKEKNVQLARAKEKSDRLRKSKDALFSRISHELRTPMYGIVGISKLMMNDRTEASNQDNIKSLKFSADYLLSLINNVLEMNKMSRVKDDFLKKETFDVRQVCNYALDSARYISQNDSNTFVFEIDERIPKMLLGDASRLSQVLINLLGNSSKFTEDGTISLELKYVSSNKNNCCVLFTIKDTGMGIAPERHSKIFEEAAYIEHYHQNEGTGLGLPISKRIIELHGAELILESELGKGTSISFTLCYDLVPLESFDNRASLISSDIRLLKGKKILVVEDNKINQVVTRKTLEKLHVEVSIANNGEEAIEVTRLDKFDLILMDINMPPGIDGFETAKFIREYDTTTPIIALTAVEQKEIKKRMKDSAMNDFIIKPFKGEQFENKLLANLK